MTETPVEPPENEIAEPEVPDYDLMDEMREAELEDVLSYIRQCAVDALRFGSPEVVERALHSLADDLQQGNHR